MAEIRGTRTAFGKPGIEPRWTHGDKEGIGTAYSRSSRIWFTVFNGIVTEVYYPTVDRPQIRDLQFMIGDGQSWFQEERKHLHTRIEHLRSPGLGYRIINSDPQNRYSLTKEVITDPQLPCLLQRTLLTGEPSTLRRLKLYALCAPHINVGGWGNNAYVVEMGGREFLTAEKEGIWLAMAATVPFSLLSVGYVGRSDGWTDLADNYRMDWEFDQATGGNVALAGELDLAGGYEFTLGLAFGDGRHSALTALIQSLSISFEDQKQRFFQGWDVPYQSLLPLEKVSGDDGHCLRESYGAILTHEDKSYPGAIIASLSIPWGEAKGDEDTGGYHLVWSRDMYQSSTSLLAAGDVRTPLRTLIYLAASQETSGNFPQNFWIDGKPYWTGTQLDEVAFPVLLAWRLSQAKALQNFDPYALALRAASFLIEYGPATQQDRWEEESGYSPSTMASNIAALICAAGFCRQRQAEATARFLEEYADFLESHLESWMVTTEGTLVPDIPRHYIRILPVDLKNPSPPEDPNRGEIDLNNLPPEAQKTFPAKEIVDTGFLELVRYGIRKPDDPIIVDSLRVVDATLRVETPLGPCWHRYNHDGYGQREDGGPFESFGKGRAWPLLAGERGHYELAAGRDPKPYIRAMEKFASATGLFSEQVWDEADRPQQFLFFGRPTGAAMPLVWAHAEYIKLLRSAYDGRVFDFLPQVADRYRNGTPRKRWEVWKRNRQVRTVEAGATLRILAKEAFTLHWSADDWKTRRDSQSQPTALGIDFADIPVRKSQRAPLRFTFYWIKEEKWEGRDYEVQPYSSR
jgi:glucoamylase